MSEEEILQENEEQAEIIEEVDTEKDQKLNKKIVIRFAYFILLSTCFLIISNISISKGLKDIQTQFVNSFVEYIMYASFVVSVIGIGFIIMYLASKKFKNQFEGMKYDTRNKIFTFLDWAVILPFCATIASFCFAFLFTLAQVDGTSMNPTFTDGSTVFVNYHESIDRFDVAVCYITEEDQILSADKAMESPTYYIKRVIGLPGDKVTWAGGILRINSEIVEETYFSEEYRKQLRGYTTNSFSGTFKYKENGEIKETTIIPEGYVFVMGDNRNTSYDSRGIGLVPIDNIIGVVKYEFNGLSIKKVEV